MRILKSVHHSKRWNGAIVVGFAGSELFNIMETQVPIRGKILIQDLEKSAHRRCTNWSESPAVSNFPERKGPLMSNFPGRKGPPMSKFPGRKGPPSTDV